MAVICSLITFTIIRREARKGLGREAVMLMIWAKIGETNTVFLYLAFYIVSFSKFDSIITFFYYLFWTHLTEVF